MERKIDFLIVGAQKSGTTTLYDWLKQHPDIFLPETKEILFFAKDEFYNQGTNYLDVFYHKIENEKIIGGAYVHLMYFPKVAKRLFEYNPELKLISVLRNPIDRAYSAYWFARTNGWETSKSFEEALKKEKIRAKGSFKEQADLTYLDHGKYAEQLHRFIKYFGHEKLLVLLSEELRERPNNVLIETLIFLGISQDENEIDFRKDSNKAGKPRIKRLQKILRGHDTPQLRVLRKLFKPSTRLMIRQNIIRKLAEWNIKEESYSPLTHETRKELMGFYLPHNKELKKLIGKNLNSWNS